MDQDKTFILEKRELDHLIQILREDGYHVVGPTVRDGAIIYDELTSMARLPKRWTQEVEAGVYRLKRRDDESYFGYVVGPHSFKKYLFPPRHRLFTIRRVDANGNGYSIEGEHPSIPRYAFLGVRACEIAAMAVQDRVLGGEMADSYYTKVRAEALVIAVNCTEPAATCFCTSMESGPRCRAGFDLALTELPESFAVEVGSPRGRALLGRLKPSVADANTRHLLDLMMRSAAEHMGRQLDTAGLPEILLTRPEHPHWAKVAQRCLACANCTMVCPTCFCWSVEDTSDLTGDHAERWRNWGSCFTLEFTYHTGGFVRSSIRARYRQWLTHKLAGWHEQFGTSGCVGCGRCIAWCPVGIDITAEASAIAEDVRQSEAQHKAHEQKAKVGS